MNLTFPGARAAAGRTAICLLAGAVVVPGGVARGQAGAPPPLLPGQAVRAIATELSGGEARHTVQDLTLFHRMRGSRGFKSASDRIAERARALRPRRRGDLAAGRRQDRLRHAAASRPGWDADFAELWEQQLQWSGRLDGRRAHRLLGGAAHHPGGGQRQR